MKYSTISFHSHFSFKPWLILKNNDQKTNHNLKNIFFYIKKKLYFITLEIKEKKFTRFPLNAVIDVMQAPMNDECDYIIENRG